MYGVIADVSSHKAGHHLGADQVNHYVTDGEVAVATLAAKV